VPHPLVGASMKMFFVVVPVVDEQLCVVKIA
jgi:hypothetical protein